MVNNICKYSSRNTSHTHREPSKKHFSCTYTFTKLYIFPWLADCPDLVLALFSVLVFVFDMFWFWRGYKYTLQITLYDGLWIWGTYHLQGKTGNSCWKIKWFATFRCGSFRKYGRRNFLSLSSLFGKFGYTLWRFVLPPLACENIGFSSAVSSLFADVPPRETSPAAKSEDKRMFSQAIPPL